MDFDNLVNQVSNFYQQYTIVVVVLAVGLLIMIYRNPKESFKFLVFLLFLGAVIYAIGLFGDTVTTGVGSKQQMIHKTPDDSH
jgi:RsiW-degrading membrane proteinase PrsW (M82 family)